MQLKDLTKGDRFRLPMGKMVFRVTEIYQETIHCVDGMSVSFTFPSDWECQKVEEVNPIHNPINRLVRHIIDHCDLYEERCSNGENIAPTILNSFPDLFKNLFTREDMVEFAEWFIPRISDPYIGVDNFLKSRKK